MRKLLKESTKNSENGEDDGDEVDDDSIFSGGILYVPFAREFVPIIDIRQRKCEIKPPNGLLDVAVMNFKSRAKEAHEGNPGSRRINRGNK